MHLRIPRPVGRRSSARGQLQLGPAEWRSIRLGGRKVAWLLRRLIGPRTVADESTRPERAGTDAPPRAGLPDGLVQGMASPTAPSWNQLHRWLEGMRQLQECLRLAA